jgi:Helix-turn-helix.
MTKPSPFNETWTEEQLAEEAGVSLRTIRRWRNARTGPPFIRLGNKTRYRIEAVRAWMLAHEQEQPRAGRGA